jgi:hypothetical protein
MDFAPLYTGTSSGSAYRRLAYIKQLGGLGLRLSAIWRKVCSRAAGQIR